MTYLLPVSFRIKNKAITAMIINMKITAIALSTSADARFRKIAMGKVSVFIAIAPANVTVAPNSPKALAQVRIPDAINPLFAIGKIILKNASGLLQPNVLPTCS
jgi:hypothetical protein